MRPDKATLVGVASTLGIYRAGRATSQIPVWQMIAAPADALRARAGQLAGQVDGQAIEVRSTVGGGSLPGETLPSWGVAVTARSSARLLDGLRRGSPPVVARVDAGSVVLDMRTVEPSRDAELAAAVRSARAALTGGAR
jgi:L-seryl-tRNA(Ser) seleniumtransferase